MKDATIIITDNEFLRQFEATVNNKLLVVEYSQQERKIFLTKIIISDTAKEEGYLEPFIEAILDVIRERNTRVVPTSPEIANFMRKNRRKYKDLLPVGINI